MQCILWNKILYNVLWYNILQHHDIIYYNITWSDTYKHTKQYNIVKYYAKLFEHSVKAHPGQKECFWIIFQTVDNNQNQKYYSGNSLCRLSLGGAYEWRKVAIFPQES